MKMLGVVKNFSETAGNRGIEWCHWKSNATLDSAVHGRTDLDVLFKEKDRGRVEDLLHDIGAVRFLAVNEKRYQQIDDYLIVDEKEGVLVHFHVHYLLDIGEKSIKSYRLPFSDEIVSSRVKHPDIDFWTISPEMEIILLAVRQALRMAPLSFRTGKMESIGKDTELEFRWLKERIRPDEVEAICRRWFSADVADRVADIINSGISAEKIGRLRRILYPLAAQYRRYSPSRAALMYYSRKVGLKVKRELNKMGYAVPFKRTMAGRGAMVAFVGVDGSGKTTLVKNACDAFREKIDVQQVYFGHGKSYKSTVVTLFDNLSEVINRLNLLVFRKNSMIAHVVLSIGIAIDKNIKFRRVESARRSGMQVICDRFPQTTVDGMCDGLRLSAYAGSWNPLLRRLARWERNIYLKREEIYPDVFFKLVVDTEVAYERRKDSKDAATIELKNNAFRRIPLPVKSRVVELENNNADLQALGKTVVAEIWRFIRGSSCR